MQATRLHGYTRIVIGKAMELWGRLVRDAGLVVEGRYERTAGEAVLVYARVRPAQQRASAHRVS